MCESIARSYVSKATPWSASSSWDRVKIRPGTGRQRRQQLELGRRQLDGRATDLGPHPGQIQHDVAGTDRLGGLERPVGPAQDGPDAGHELARAERLGQVVVGTELEAEQLVELVVTGREHDDRDRRVAAQLAGHVEAVEPGQPEVEDDQVGSSLADRRQGGRAVAGGQHGEARVLEVVAGEGGDLRFVVDDEDGLHRSHRRAGCAPGRDVRGRGEWGRRAVRRCRSASSGRSGRAARSRRGRGGAIRRTPRWRGSPTGRGRRRRGPCRSRSRPSRPVPSRAGPGRRARRSPGSGRRR